MSNSIKGKPHCKSVSPNFFIWLFIDLNGAVWGGRATSWTRSNCTVVKIAQFSEAINHFEDTIACLSIRLRSTTLSCATLKNVTALQSQKIDTVRTETLLTRLLGKRKKCSARWKINQAVWREKWGYAVVRRPWWRCWRSEVSSARRSSLEGGDNESSPLAYCHWLSCLLRGVCQAALPKEKTGASQ